MLMMVMERDCGRALKYYSACQRSKSSPSQHMLQLQLQASRCQERKLLAASSVLTRAVPEEQVPIFDQPTDCRMLVQVQDSRERRGGLVMIWHLVVWMSD
jgi:hypothetical protein